MHLESGDDTLILDGQTKALEGTLLDKADGVYRTKYDIGMRDSPGELSLFRVVFYQAMAWRENDFPNSATGWKFP